MTLTKGGTAQSTNKEVNNHPSVTEPKATSRSDSFNKSDSKVGMLKLHKYISDVLSSNFVNPTFATNKYRKWLILYAWI